jgi:hypothetical protein
MEVNGVDVPNPAAGDLGPEGILFIEAKDSPNRKPLVVVGNEISGTTTIYQIDRAGFPGFGFGDDDDDDEDDDDEDEDDGRGRGRDRD